MEKDEWQDIEPGIWKPEKPVDQIIGVLLRKEPEDKTAQLSARYFLENDEGAFMVWGSAVLDDRMQLVKVGDKIRIHYEGKTKNKRGQDVNLFKVAKAKAQATIAGNNDDNKEMASDSKKEVETHSPQKGPIPVDEI